MFTASWEMVWNPVIDSAAFAQSDVVTSPARQLFSHAQSAMLCGNSDFT
ncbi:MAG: hypothetical protein WCO64_05120 [Actinomycetes bacterium]